MLNTGNQPLKVLAQSANPARSSKTRLAFKGNKVKGFHERFTERIIDPLKVIRHLVDRLPDSTSFLKLKLLVQNDEWSQITQWEFEPTRFLNAQDAADELAALSLLRKYVGFKELIPDVKTKEVALRNWFAAEEQCRQTNDRFRSYADGNFQMFPSVDSVLYGVRRKIARILASVSPDDIFSHGNFGPGVDLGTRRFASPINKMRSPGHATPRLIRAMDKNHVFDWPVFEMMKTANGIVPIIGTPANRVTFVPKNAKTDRSIAIEPRWNIFFQKGAGHLIRTALKRQGCDLNDQTRNQSFASDLSYATVDLSNASDTLSRNLVYDLLPVDWALALDSLRSPISTMPDGTHRVLEKFSSMGNGFTFELESLIFFAISWQVSEDMGYDRDVSVFGDDIIVKVDCYPKLVEVLEACGFSINTEKSFATGLYRESCGKHFFSGTHISPIFLKEVPHNAERLIGLANQIGRLAGSISNSTVRDRRFLGCRRAVIRFVPKDLRFYGPRSIDTCIHSSVDEHVLPRHECFEAFVAWVPVFVPNRFDASDLALLFEKLIKPTNNGNFFSVRSDGLWNIKKVLVTDEDELGPWS